MNQNKIIVHSSRYFKPAAKVQNTQQLMQIQKLKEQQKVKQIEKINEYETDKMKEAIIKPVKIVKENFDIETKYNDLEKGFKNKCSKYWENRTNIPYKVIIRDENEINKFINKKKINEDDLVVHKVTPKDKIGVDEDLKKLENTLEVHNNELKVLYSANKKTEHKQKFEYNHKYKYRVKYEPSDHNQLKNNNINYLKQEQQKLEENKEKLDNIIDSLINNGIFNEDELQEMKMSKDFQKVKTVEINPNVKDKYLTRQKKN